LFITIDLFYFTNDDVIECVSVHNRIHVVHVNENTVLAYNNILAVDSEGMQARQSYSVNNHNRYLNNHKMRAALYKHSPSQKISLRKLKTIVSFHDTLSKY